MKEMLMAGYCNGHSVILCIYNVLHLCHFMFLHLLHCATHNKLGVSSYT